MGKKPFSAKAKREQLRKKRLATTGEAPPSVRGASSKQAGPSSVTAATSQPPSQSSSQATTPTSSTPRHARGRAPRGSHSNRYRLQLAESDAGKKTELAHAILQPTRADRMHVDDIRPYPDARFAMPRRPAWRFDDALETLNRREGMALRTWRHAVVSADDTPPFFEHNLETWRQLWRVLERSDVIVMVVDIRFPALHFVPDLYHHVVDDLAKGFVLALNKCDLVSMDVLTSWRAYFLNKYPRLSVAMFSSFPDAKLAPCKSNSDLLSKRERRMARSKLSAWGADQLLAAVRQLHLPENKLAFLEEWRDKLAPHSEDDQLPSFSPSAPLPDQPPNSEPNSARKRSRTALQPDSDSDDDDHHDEQSQPVHTHGQPGVSSTLADDADSGDNMITIGIVGHPNAGKSSLINGIFRRKVVSTSKTPGHTKHLQTMFLSQRVRLCDCPGLVFPGLASRELQILAGMFPIAQVRDPFSVVHFLAERVDLVAGLGLAAEVGKLEDLLLERRYVVDGWSAWKICEAWAMKRGYRTAKAARLDVYRAANHILRLALEGRIVLATLPKGFVGGPPPTDDGIRVEDGGQQSLLDGLQDGGALVDGSFVHVSGSGDDMEDEDESEHESEHESEDESEDESEEEEEDEDDGANTLHTSRQSGFELLRDED